MSGAYYNEIDPYAAQWLRNLIRGGHIAPGDVDERSIEDVRPNDLRGYTQCHFFAGIGVWSYALRLAGWSDDRPVWTGSCPCQPFSSAGKGDGFADERHLWPAFHHLIKERKPAIVFGEQVASKDADVWIDLVQIDMEALGYAFGCVPFPSAGVGAPHIRDRNYWVADANYKRLEGRKPMRQRSAQFITGESGLAYGMADPAGDRRKGKGARRPNEKGRQPQSGCTGQLSNGSEGYGSIGGLEHANITIQDGQSPSREQPLCYERDSELQRIDRAGPTNGFWRDVDWLGCTDGRWRPVEPGTFPLADGITNRMDKLRAYGNAINAQAAAEFIRATIN